MIGEDTIMAHLRMLLETSEPGASIHHLHVVAGPLGPLGAVVDESALQSTVYAIVPSGDVDPEDFLQQTVMAASLQAHQRGHRVVFAALSQEVWGVPMPPDELAVRLHREGRLQEHPDVVEQTVVYGACRDGRRWTGRRWLTGPQAGRMEDVEVLVGRPDRGEGFGPLSQLVRRLAGMAR